MMPEIHLPHKFGFSPSSSAGIEGSLEIIYFSLQQLLVAQNPYRIENKLEKMMQILMTIEDAHQKLR